MQTLELNQGEIPGTWDTSWGMVALRTRTKLVGCSWSDGNASCAQHMGRSFQVHWPIRIKSWNWLCILYSVTYFINLQDFGLLSMTKYSWADLAKTTGNSMSWKSQRQRAGTPQCPGSSSPSWELLRATFVSEMLLGDILWPCRYWGFDKVSAATWAGFLGNSLEDFRGTKPLKSCAVYNLEGDAFWHVWICRSINISSAFFCSLQVIKILLCITE